MMTPSSGESPTWNHQAAKVWSLGGLVNTHNCLCKQQLETDTSWAKIYVEFQKRVLIFLDFFNFSGGKKMKETLFFSPHLLMWHLVRHLSLARWRNHTATDWLGHAAEWSAAFGEFGMLQGAAWTWQNIDTMGVYSVSLSNPLRIGKERNRFRH